MPQMNRLSTYCTTIAANERGETTITYHATPIVTFDRDTVVLRTGGWDTVTTRRKMEQAARQFGLGFRVYRDKGESRVVLPDGRNVPLIDGMMFDRHNERAMA